jgi:SAM-dependent methyltransferase
MAWVRDDVKARIPWKAHLAARRVLRAANPARRAREAAAEADARHAAEVLSPLDSTVHGGPFGGMVGLTGSNWDAVGPYLVGSYEEELHPHLERLLAKAPPVVVNIGASAGYYAIGAARRLPKAVVIAVDIEPSALALCRQLASANGVADRVRTRKRVTTGNLRHWLSPDSLVISDCEGCELELLDPLKVPQLRSVDLIVELHDAVDPTISQTIRSRFAPTHEVTVVNSTGRAPDVDRYPALAKLPPAMWTEVLDEHRWPPPPDPRMSWAVLETLHERPV